MRFPTPFRAKFAEKATFRAENSAVEPVKAPSRPLTKREALTAYCELLGDVELPRKLVARATAADLVEARADIVRHIASLESGDGWRNQNTRLRSLDLWKLARGHPKIVEEFGRPFLEGVIRDRLRAADEVARAKPSIKLPLHLEPETVRKLLPAGADPDENEAALIEAAIGAIRGGIELRQKLVQDQEWVDRINYRVTSFPPWGVRPARITSPKPIEQSVASDPVAVEQDPEQETHKTTALDKLCALLRGGELPIELVAEAEADDLEQALEGCLSAAGIPSGREPTAREMALQRSWARHSPDELVELFGAPLLQEAINQGKAEAAAREKAERQERGVDVVLPISPALVDELMQLWDASADRKALAIVACAALEAIRTWVNRPPPPPPPIPQVTLDDYPLMTHPGAMFRLTLGR